MFDNYYAIDTFPCKMKVFSFSPSHNLNIELEGREFKRHNIILQGIYRKEYANFV